MFIHNLLNNIFLGNKISRRNKMVKNYISLTYNNFDFFNVKKIIIILFLVKKYIKNSFFQNKKFLFVSTKNFLREIVYKYSRSLKQNYVCNKWVGGILTNPNNYKKMLNKIVALKKQKKMNFTKKEKIIFNKTEKKIEILYGGLRNMKKIPEIIIITDIEKEKIAINEAKRLKLKIIAFADSNDIINGIDFIIPFNKNSIFCIKNIFKIIFSDIC